MVHPLDEARTTDPFSILSLPSFLLYHLLIREVWKEKMEAETRIHVHLRCIHDGLNEANG